MDSEFKCSEFEPLLYLNVWLSKLSKTDEKMSKNWSLDESGFQVSGLRVPHCIYCSVLNLQPKSIRFKFTWGGGPAMGTWWNRNSIARVTLGADQQSTHPSAGKQVLLHFLVTSSRFQCHLPSRVAILAFRSNEYRMSWLVFVSGKNIVRSRLKPCKETVLTTLNWYTVPS